MTAMLAITPVFEPLSIVMPRNYRLALRRLRWRDGLDAQSC